MMTRQVVEKNISTASDCKNRSQGELFLSYTMMTGGSGMTFYKNRYEIVECKIRDLQEERKALIELVMELFRQVEELEQRLDELYRSCKEEQWF